ncbi:hypothetical protein HID58_087408 [Brassica napus]|uniref:Uncharacterized protein n=1 Tax=Brassica napus TaxID=3708 RepID=A0ABQ7XTC1_BRANA|nr:hypothetical protein HID58_087408 [Brassica napus]
MLISSLSSKSDFEKSKLSLTSKSRSQEYELMSESFLSSKHTGSDQSLTCKSGLRIMSSSGVCVLSRRVEEFIQKVNTKWKLENILRV